MYEEADGSVRDVSAEELRHQEQVIVVHPNEVSWLVDVENCASEGGVGGLVGCPVRVRAEGRRVLGGRHVLPEQIVEERPQSCD